MATVADRDGVRPPPGTASTGVAGTALTDSCPVGTTAADGDEAGVWAWRDMSQWQEPAGQQRRVETGSGKSARQQGERPESPSPINSDRHTNPIADPWRILAVTVVWELVVVKRPV